jgi:hypothetical protein
VPESHGVRDPNVSPNLNPIDAHYNFLERASRNARYVLTQPRPDLFRVGDLHDRRLLEIVRELGAVGVSLFPLNAA